MREIDDISDAFWECVLYSGESAVGFSFIFSFGATLNNFFEETTPLFFVFFARRGCSLISLSFVLPFVSMYSYHDVDLDASSQLPLSDYSVCLYYSALSALKRQSLKATIESRPLNQRG